MADRTTCPTCCRLVDITCERKDCPFVSKAERKVHAAMLREQDRCAAAFFRYLVKRAVEEASRG